MSKSTSGPVIIPVTGDDSSCRCEWTILELNGELIVPSELPSLDNPQQMTTIVGPGEVELGTLRFEDEKTPVLIVGTHELKGSIQHMKQPFCVFEKERGVASTTTTTTEDDFDVKYKVVGSISTKLLFNNYPKTIMR